KWRAGLGAAARLATAELRLRRWLDEPFDAVIVGYPGHLDVGAARRAAEGRPLVFNPLVSVCDTLVGDRGRFRAGSLAARALRAIDRRAFGAADLVVSDTAAHAEVCFVGAEERVFRPGWEGGGPVLFVGKLIPLHGLDTILAAARLAPDVPF